MRLGALDLSIRNDSSASIDIDMKRLVIHADHNKLTHENDIALIELNRSVFFHKIFIRPACLQQKNYNGEALIAVRLIEYDSRRRVHNKTPFLRPAGGKPELFLHHQIFC